MTGKTDKATADNLTDEQLSYERAIAWHVYHIVCAASGFVPLHGGVVPISQSSIDKARLEIATIINARREAKISK